ncbi:MAG TPA: sulfotransferase [Streptosporangiaceae bacterium]|jgi:hypothetical protein|nr:sulfotransferase [Streptosporangiaceae bacterium]
MDLFVVGSGRCGSTLLGDMLGKHPDLLEFSEFFAALDRAETFSHAEISGSRFAEFLDRIDVANEIITRRHKIPVEVLHQAPGSDGGVPPLMIATLPLLSSDPLALYAELLAAVSAFPVQTYREHYRDLFQWLMKRTGKQYWLERSGTSIEYLSQLIDFFPDAKYVYLHRDGAECALSMQHHVAFQVYVPNHFQPLTREELRATDYGGHPITDDDPLSRRLSPDFLSAAKYAEYWSYQQIMGFKALARLAPEQFIFVTFEDVIGSPHNALRRIAAFFGLPEADDWIATAASLVKGMPPSRLDALPTAQQAEIRQACEPGDLLLGRKTAPLNSAFSRTVWESGVR